MDWILSHEFKLGNFTQSYDDFPPPEPSIGDAWYPPSPEPENHPRLGYFWNGYKWLSLELNLHRAQIPATYGNREVMLAVIPQGRIIHLTGAAWRGWYNSPLWIGLAVPPAGLLIAKEEFLPQGGNGFSDCKLQLEEREWSFVQSLPLVAFISTSGSCGGEFILEWRTVLQINEWMSWS